MSTAQKSRRESHVDGAGGVIEEQDAEDHYDDRSYDDDDSDDESFDKSRIKFSTKKLYGRDSELSTLRKIYDQLQQNQTAQIVFLPGYSGIGKSSLISEFIDQISTATSTSSTMTSSSPTHQPPPPPPPWFWYGKFEELQSPDPYKAIAIAISKFCVSLFQSPEEEEDGGGAGVDSTVRSLLRDAIKREIREGNSSRRGGLKDLKILTELIPELGKLLSAEQSDEENCSPNNNININASTTEDQHHHVDDASEASSLQRSISARSGASTATSIITTHFLHENPKSIYRLKHVFRLLVKAIATSSRPLIFFLDDLQWIDIGSLELLSSLLYDPKLQNVLFIGSYRSNEVSSDHILSSVITEISRHRTSSDNVHTVEVAGLQKVDICEFIADTLNLDVVEVSELADAIYNKSFGNIFFTKQALEELLRKNVLFYDMVQFRWDWNFKSSKGNEIQRAVSDDVVHMIQSKMKNLKPKLLQFALTISSFIGSSIDVPTLYVMLKTKPIISSLVGDDKSSKDEDRLLKSVNDLIKLLDKAVMEGLLVKEGQQSYTFSHDRIQEAATSFVKDEKAREKVLIRIAFQLIQRSKDAQVGEEWMLFVGVHHLNAFCTIDQNADILDDAMYASFNTRLGFTANELAELNLEAAKSAITKSAFTQAVALLRAGVRYLDPATRWGAEQYDLCLELHNLLIAAEFSVGNHEESLKAIDKVLAKDSYTRLSDKCLAQSYYLEIQQFLRKYADAIPKALEFLAEHDITIPPNPSKAHIMKEKMKLRVVQRNRSLAGLMDLEPMEDYDDAVMGLLKQLGAICVFSNEQLANATIIIGQRLSWEKGINRHLSTMLFMQATVARKAGNFKEACKIGSVCLEMSDRFCEGRLWAKPAGMVTGCILWMRWPLEKVQDYQVEAYRVCLAHGDVETGLLAIMSYCWGYFCAGHPINAIFEAKLIHYEDECRRLNQPLSIRLTFCLFQQFVLNLYGKGNKDPCILKGNAVNEDDVASQLQGFLLNQAVRDFGILRLLLAYVFHDEDCQKEMVDRLKDYGFDFPLMRQHLRDALVGLTALSLGRKYKDKKYLAIGREKYQEFQKLVKSGSVIAQPIAVCMKAEEKPSRSNFQEAIDICSKEGLLHFQGAMNERCGLMLLNDGDKESAREYLTRAFWNFSDWGATGKVERMRNEHEFLKDCRRSESTANGLLNLMTKARISHTG